MKKNVGNLDAVLRTILAGLLIYVGLVALDGARGEILGILIFLAAGVVWALVPLIDRRDGTRRAARVATWIGIGALAGLVVFTVWGYAVL